MIRTTLLTTAFVLAGTISFAGNISEPITAAPIAPLAPMAPSGDWTGFYAGGQYITGNADVGGFDNDLDGYGVHAGYLYDMGAFVLGGELDYDSIENQGGAEGSVTRAKVIAGYDLGSFMPYITAGGVNINLDGVGVDNGTFYGLGGSYQISDKFRVGGEYLVHQIGDFAGTGLDVDMDTFSLRASYNF